MVPEKAIAAFGEAVWHPEMWPDALETMASACGARMVTLVNWHTKGELTCSRRARPAIEQYLHSRTATDSRQGRVNPTLTEGFRTDYDDFQPSELARDPYYQDFLRPLDVGWHAAASLPGLDEPLVISFKRSPRQGPFERHDVEALDKMLPNLRAGARHAALIARSRFDGELAAFARLNRGAIYLNDDGNVVAMNGRVEFGDGLLCDGRTLSAALSEDRTALRRAIAATARLAPAGQGTTSSPLVVRRPSGKQPYVVDVIAVPAGDFADPKRTRTLVLINDLHAQVQPRREAMQLAFGLTPRETDLAQGLASGMTLCDAAQALHISEQHARQRLKMLFEKTGTSRQAELMVLLGRLG